MRQKAYVTLLVAAAISLAACGHHSGPRPGQETLGMVTDVGGLGDKSFNDSAYSGLVRAQTNLGAYINVLQSRSAADYQPNLSTLSDQKYDMIYAIGFLMSKDLDQVAKDHPTQQYAIIDAVINDPNVVSVTFQEQDGSFLAGALAALVSKTHHVAFLGGQDIPLMRKFETGFTAGVHEIAPGDKVDVKYADSFEDVSAGKELANLEYQSGADIIFAAAGKAGLGAIDAAKLRPNAYIIGVDSDQDGLAPGKILTSMVKHVDVAVYDIAQDIKNGKNHGGQHLTLGLADQAITLTDFQYTSNIVGPDFRNKISALQQMIINHDIVVPATREALASFKPVKM